MLFGASSKPFASVAAVGAPVRDVRRDGVVEQRDVLRDYAHASPQGLDGDGFDVSPSDEDLPGVRVVEAREESKDRGLPGAGLADEGAGGARRDGEVEAVEDRRAALLLLLLLRGGGGGGVGRRALAAAAAAFSSSATSSESVLKIVPVVGEPHVPQLHAQALPLRRPRQRHGPRGVRDRGPDAEKRKERPHVDEGLPRLAVGRAEEVERERELEEEAVDCFDLICFVLFCAVFFLTKSKRW